MTSRRKNRHLFPPPAYLALVDLPGRLVEDLLGVASEGAPALDDVAPEGLEGVLEVPLDPVGKVLRVAGDPLPAVLDGLPVDLDAEGLQVGRVPHLPDPAGGGQEGLGGDAAPVDAGPAHVGPGKDGRAEALGPGVEGSAVAADPAPDDGHVKVVAVPPRHPQGGGGRRMGGRGEPLDCRKHDEDCCEW